MTSPFTDDTRPTAVDDVETALFEGEAVLFREATRTIHRLNATAAAVWVCCDGETSVADMVDELAEVFGVSVDETRPRVAEALEQLAELALLSGDLARPTVKVTPVDDRASDGSRIISCPPDT